MSGAGLAWWVGAFEAVSCLARCYVTVPLPCKPPAMGPTHLRGSYRADLRHRCALLLPCTSCLWAVVSFAMKVTALPPLLVAGCAARQSLHAPAARPAAPPPMLADAAAAALLASALPALPPVLADALCHCTPCEPYGAARVLANAAAAAVLAVAAPLPVLVDAAAAAALLAPAAHASVCSQELAPLHSLPPVPHGPSTPNRQTIERTHRTLGFCRSLLFLLRSVRVPSRSWASEASRVQRGQKLARSLLRAWRSDRAACCSCCVAGGIRGRFRGHRRGWRVLRLPFLG